MTAAAEQPADVAWRSGARRTKAEIEADRVEMGVPATAAQARLDAIAHPSDQYSRSFLKWVNRFSNQPGEYPSEQLVEEAYALGAEIAELKRETEDPPEEMTGAEWQERYVRLQRRLGMAKAIADVLQRRVSAERNRAEIASREGHEPAGLSREVPEAVTQEDAAAPHPSDAPVARQDDQGEASDDAAAPDAQTNGDAALSAPTPAADAAPTQRPTLSQAGQELRQEWMFLLGFSTLMDRLSDELPPEQYEACRTGLARQIERVENRKVLYASGSPGSPDPAEVMHGVEVSA